MESLIQHLNSVSGISATETSKIKKNFGTGALGFSPMPLLKPKSSLSFVQSHWIAPVGLNLESKPDANDRFWIPTDPQISISGANKVVKREIANGAAVDGISINGTVKELWRTDDITVSFAGVLITDLNNTQTEYQKVGDQVKRMVELLSAKEALIVQNDVLNNQFGITRLVVESFSFPATNGTDNQLFTFTCVSDDSYNLIVD